MKQILIIEDDEDTAFLYQMVTVMNLDGVQVELISDGLEAINRLRNEAYRPAIIVLDLHLPYVPGTEILEAARQRGIKVIVTSADANLAHTIAEKADLTLIKPLENPTLLTDLIARLL